MFELQQAVVLKLGEVRLPATVIKISYTSTHTWYGVRLDSGEDLHGIEEHRLAAE